eukprot:TRINITY_DN4662_c0_g4_i1.p1 TRINITY_DN4662_c0_g4~~TRINITY_DN4662_c0_g4_i1.p1  ORF type:complete len:623 (-),score=154.03 TRINITY_DN4662_c0_g4_i1:59-1927(-)
MATENKKPTVLRRLGRHDIDNQRSLKVLLRNRIHYDVIQYTLNGGIVRPASASAGYDASNTHPMLVLVADKPSMGMIDTACDMQYLSQAGICLYLSLEEENKPDYPLIDAVYIMEPTMLNVQLLSKDMTAKKYRNYFVFISLEIDNLIMKEMAKMADAAERLSSFVELNLDFYCYDSVCFHFNDYSHIDEMFKHGLQKQARGTSGARKLATVLLTLGDPQKILFDKSKANCKRMADELRERILHIDKTCAESMKQAALEEQDNVRITVVIVDRSFDWHSALIEDLRYEALIMNSYGSRVQNEGREDIGVSKRSIEGRNAEDKECIWTFDAEKDEVFKEYRHLPIWAVNARHIENLEAWSRRDEELKEMSSGDGGPKAAAEALRELPAHKKRFETLDMHSKVLTQCMRQVDDTGLSEIAAAMCDVSNNLDEEYRELSQYNLYSTVESLVKDANRSLDSRLHLAMLYAHSPHSTPEEVQTLSESLDDDGKKILLSKNWQMAAKDLDRVHEETAKRSLNAGQDKQAPTTPRGKKMCRWTSMIRDVALQAADDKLGDDSRFTTVKVPNHERKGRPCVVLFIQGGVSLADVRTIQQLDVERHDIEFFLGGSCMLTPDDVCDAVLNGL